MSAAPSLLGALARPRRALLGVAGLFLLLESAAALAIPFLGGTLAGALLQGQPWTHVVGYLVVALAAQSLLRFAAAHALDRAADEIVADLRVRLYDHLQALPLSFFHEGKQGETLALLTNDVYVVGGYLSHTLVAVVPLALTALGAAAMMFRIDWVVAAWVAAMIPLYFLLIKLIGRRIRPVSRTLQREEAAAVALAQENLAMLPVIKSFTREAHELGRYRDQIGRVREAAARQRLLVTAFGPMMQFVAACSVVLLVAAAGSSLVGSAAGPAALVTLFLYAQLLARPVSGLADVYGQTQMALGALTRLEDVMQEPREHGVDARELPRLRGEIEFAGVTFSYPRRPPALRSLELRIAAGEVVALVGANGAGKSTVAHLLTRLHDPDAGSIRIDGIDIAAASLASLRRQVGVVPQNVMLFNASIAENIAYGLPGADPEAILEAAKAATAHEFIARLPEGYRTLIGDQGVRLSGGQRQKIALARALLKDPPILVLDEATSMFDPAAERDFLESCLAALRGRTVILITHRPAALAIADRIITLESGAIGASPAATRAC